MSPIKLNVQIYVPGVVSFGGHRYRGRSTIGQVPFRFDTMVHGLRRVRYRGRIYGDAVTALAFIPPHHRCHIPKSDKGWTTEELCWVDAPAGFNRKGPYSHVLTEFLESGSLQWLVEENT